MWENDVFKIIFFQRVYSHDLLPRIIVDCIIIISHLDYETK